MSLLYELYLNKALIFHFKVISFQIEFSCITIETKKIKHLYARYEFVNHGAGAGGMTQCTDCSSRGQAQFPAPTWESSAPPGTPAPGNQGSIWPPRTPHSHARSHVEPHTNALVKNQIFSEMKHRMASFHKSLVSETLGSCHVNM